MTLEELKSKLRPVEERDRGKLISVSYSKLDLLKQCSMKYKLKYVDGMYSNQQTLPLELGSILHKGMELKGRAKILKQPVKYNEIESIVLNGCEEKTDKGSEKLLGIVDIKKKYFDEWFKKEALDEKTYDEKIDLYFSKVLHSRMEDPEWKVIAVEQQFEFVYDNRCIIHGFIDRIDKKEDELKVVDYKSSKKTFREEDIKTPLQMVVYDMACVFLYGVLPTYHEYDFILLNQKQTTINGVCSKGYLTRGLKKIDSLLDLIEEMEKTKIYKPTPSPLCYWCSFPDKCHTPNAESRYAGTCQYYSLWKPDQKSFKVNKEYIPGVVEAPKRKLIF